MGVFVKLTAKHQPRMTFGSLGTWLQQIFQPLAMTINIVRGRTGSSVFTDGATPLNAKENSLAALISNCRRTLLPCSAAPPHQRTRPKLREELFNAPRAARGREPAAVRIDRPQSCCQLDSKLRWR